MEKLQLKVKRLDNCHDLPRYATSGSAGMDLTAGISEPLTIAAGKRSRVKTGLIIEIPPGYEGQLRPRSGLADKAGLSLTNCVGTIDSDYRGEVQVLMINHGDADYTIEPGERIAQLVVMPVPKVEIVEVAELSDSHERGAGGFGSTGKSMQALSAAKKA